MWKYATFTGAGMKVMYDKATDYLSYYSGLAKPNEINNSEKNDDTIQDYDGVLKIELYQDESNNKRLYPGSSFIDEYTTFFNKPTHIIDNIYLGSAFNAATFETLKELNIKVIMNATSEISNYFPDEFEYIRYELYDNNKHSIKKYLEKSFNDITFHQENTPGDILIHCFMGASRSASIVLYYLMKKKRHVDGKAYSFDDALKFIKSKRTIVNPTFRLTKDLASSIYMNK